MALLTAPGRVGAKAFDNVPWMSAFHAEWKGWSSTLRVVVALRAFVIGALIRVLEVAQVPWWVPAQWCADNVAAVAIQ